MTKIIINKGFISYGGRFYMAGEVLPVADNNCARRMVARSGGDFDFYHGQEIPAVNEGETTTTDENAIPAADGEEEDDEEADPLGGGVSESDNGGEGLPAIDADAAVQTAKTSKGKRK